MGRVQSRRSARSKKTTLILDATPLIYLCKSNLAKYLKVLADDYKLCTTPEVYQEVYTKGLQKQVAEIEALKDLFQGGLVQVLPERREEINPENVNKFESLKSSGLHMGEVTIIRAAISIGGTAIMDDKRARSVARSVGVDLAGTVNLVVELVKLKAISKSVAKEGIKRMINEGWYCSTKDYIQMMDAIESS